MVNMFCKRVDEHNSERAKLGYLKVCGFHQLVLQVLAGMHEKHELEELMTRPGPRTVTEEDAEHGYSEQQLQDMLAYIPPHFCGGPEDDCPYHSRWKEIKTKETQVLLRDSLTELKTLRDAIDEILKHAGQRNVGMALHRVDFSWSRGVQVAKEMISEHKKAAMEKLLSPLSTTI
jgi:hypothetical protein